MNTKSILWFHFCILLKMNKVCSSRRDNIQNQAHTLAKLNKVVRLLGLEDSHFHHMGFRFLEVVLIIFKREPNKFFLTICMHCIQWQNQFQNFLIYIKFWFWRHPRLVVSYFDLINFDMPMKNFPFSSFWGKHLSADWKSSVTSLSDLH